MDTATLLGLFASLVIAGAVLSLFASPRRRLAGWIATAAVAVASLPLAAVVWQAFTASQSERTLLRVPALGATLTVGVDPLSAVFLALTGLIGLLATLYSVEYMTQFREDGVARFYPVLLVFLAAVAGVLVARDMVVFLVCWELMTLSSFFLVAFEGRNPASQRAALKYFVMTHAASLCLVAAVLLLWREAGSFHFGALRAALVGLLATRPLLAHGVLLLFFLGFATKAGLLPMGDWLPDAHPAAPSGVSAALSGLLVKLGIYGLVRVFVSFLPASAASEGWGIAIALVGAASLFLGTLTALEQEDAKRLMAFHTIGQIGYVCLALGAGVALLPRSPALGALGLMAALLHALNHACFKSCLFLGAGSVLFRTGERDLDRLGGLAAFMPLTAATTTVASLAIAGVPPLNGFASKWLIVVTCLAAGMTQPLFLLLGLLALFVSLATLASFAKVIGTVFLGPPSEHPVAEVPGTMAAPQAVLAALCVLLGLLPQLPLRLLHRAVEALVPVPSFASLLGGHWAAAVVLEGRTVAVLAPLALATALALGAGLAYAVQRAGGAEVRLVPVWNCGEEHASADVRYRASSFYQPFRRAFAGIYPAARLAPPAIPQALHRALDLDRWLYLPAAAAVQRAARALSRTHVGVPQVYLLWIVGGAIAVAGLLLAVAR
ncbi:MAG TPA: proton-conducting transporter membrane subunit [Vicinamibacteria bacterium]|nr:proton-conducting transporter membrane subunit [Vicinamibacteria bacterium]